jgi:hypothetical protein
LAQVVRAAQAAHKTTALSAAILRLAPLLQTGADTAAAEVEPRKMVEMAVLAVAEEVRETTPRLEEMEILRLHHHPKETMAETAIKMRLITGLAAVVEHLL